MLHRLLGSARTGPFALFLCLPAIVAVFGATAVVTAQTTAADGAAPPANEPIAVATEPKVDAPAPAPAPHLWLNVASASPTGAPSSHDDEGWHFAVMPYGFLSALHGELRARDRAVEIDKSFSEITDVLKFAAGIRLEAQEEKFGFNFDNNYVHLGDDIHTERAIVPDFRFDLTLNVTELEPTYRLWKTGEQEDPAGGPKFAVDVIGGLRAVHFTDDILVRRAILGDEERSGSSTYVHGYLGNRFVASPWKYVTLEGRYNIALASDFSWFVNGTADVRPWEHFSFGAGIQVLDLSLENDSKDAALDARFFGPTVFLKFHF